MAEPKKITELWAWIIQEPDGGEGVPASSALMPGYFLPLMGADGARMKSLEEHARAIASLSGLPIRLERFANSEIVSPAGPTLEEKMADLALRLAELAEIETGTASEEKEGHDMAVARLGKATGYLEASQLLQAAVREHIA
jgi:hypothetical protein